MEYRNSMGIKSCAAMRTVSIDVVWMADIVIGSNFLGHFLVHKWH